MQTNDPAQYLAELIEKRTARVAVIGPAGTWDFRSRGRSACRASGTGFDIDGRKIGSLRRGSPTSSSRLRIREKAGRGIQATDEFGASGRWTW
jgi:hypothetical protein